MEVSGLCQLFGSPLSDISLVDAFSVSFRLPADSLTGSISGRDPKRDLACHRSLADCCGSLDAFADPHLLAGPPRACVVFCFFVTRL